MTDFVVISRNAFQADLAEPVAYGDRLAAKSIARFVALQEIHIKRP